MPVYFKQWKFGVEWKIRLWKARYCATITSQFHPTTHTHGASGDWAPALCTKLQVTIIASHCIMSLTLVKLYLVTLLALGFVNNFYSVKYH